MDHKQELRAARNLLLSLHQLGGPNPDQLSPQEILARYHQLLDHKPAPPELTAEQDEPAR